MTDQKTPAAAPCPDCRALMPATMEDRAAHRDWHADLKSKHRGVQRRIGELAEVASRAADSAATTKRAVDNIEIPEPVEPMRIEEWPADEVDQADDSSDDTTEEEAYRQQNAREDAEAAFSIVADATPEPSQPNPFSGVYTPAYPTMPSL